MNSAESSRNLMSRMRLLAPRDTEASDMDSRVLIPFSVTMPMRVMLTAGY
jgi:hypothetical protein